VIANVGVLLAAAGSDLLTSRWPDILVGGVIASVFLPMFKGVWSTVVNFPP
jgi:hypothetical protein